MKAYRSMIALGLLAGATAAPQAALAEDTIKIGLLATLEGAFTVLGQDSMRGADLAFKEANYMAGGKKIEVIKGSSDASPDSAVKAARKLVEQDGVQILIGPLSGDEGLAVKDYAKTQPNVTFINGTSAAQDTTLRDPAPNFYRFTTDGAQWMAGLGEYAFKDKHYHTVVTVAEDYSFPYTQVFGFMADFCKAGGHVPKKFWVPIGNKDFSSVIAAIPDKVDAIYVALGGADGVNFLTQYQQAGGTVGARKHFCRLSRRLPWTTVADASRREGLDDGAGPLHRPGRSSRRHSRRSGVHSQPRPATPARDRAFADRRASLHPVRRARGRALSDRAARPRRHPQRPAVTYRIHHH